MSDNFYLDNEDLKFHVTKMFNWKPIVDRREDYNSEDCPYSNAEEAKETFADMLADPIGELAATRIAPRADAIDKEGCSFKDGEVIFPEGLRNNIKDLRDAQLCGITIGREWGGLYFPKSFYSAATEIISRADASLMNLFGLQGVGETIEQFGSDEQREKYLHRISDGEWIAAMLLTEADAGSELGAMQTKATLDTDGTWRLSGTKRFITFGCGEVLVTLARSEDPESAGGPRGVSLFVVQKGEGVAVRRIEHKLGIHGSPTCEVHFDNAPAELIGERGKGLSRYGLWLMKEARLGVAAQAVGICQAALEQSRKYADEREQFGQKIREFPAVAEMLAQMQLKTEAARTILYTASFMVDMEEVCKKAGEKKEAMKYSRLVDIITPLAKYFAAEVCNEVADDGIQIHGGNGYTNEYPVERLARDARITNIYEGTSQIQISWAMARILRGRFNPYLNELMEQNVSTDLEPLLEMTKAAHKKLSDSIAFVKEQEESYGELMARRIADIVCDVLIAYEFIKQAGVAGKGSNKEKVARKWVHEMAARTEMNAMITTSGQKLEL